MRIILLILIIILLTQHLQCDTLKVGSGQEYASLQAAAAVAVPGDVIMFMDNNVAGGIYLSGLNGNSANYITITSLSKTIITGGGNAIQFSDVNRIILSNLVIEGQTGNGINIDDGGSYDTPTTKIILRDIEFRELNATGNNDQLKMSGVDSFLIENCIFQNGSAGGSMIDMVGCHYGEIKLNRFSDAGSNAIQAKGGSSDITISRNSFINAGQRAINIGGSTGTAFFRPLGTNYESTDIKVWSNFFSGSMAPVAFVGTTNSEVVNNTIYNPDKWVMRILQENVEQGMEPCANNRFTNNIVVVANKASNPSINIGPNTLPESFQFHNNLWYNFENAGWNGPNLPSANINAILNVNPQIKEIQNGDIHLLPGSPAVRSGKDMFLPEFDYYGNKYNTKRCIGASEDSAISMIEFGDEDDLSVFPNPASDRITIRYSSELKNYFQAEEIIVSGVLCRAINSVVVTIINNSDAMVVLDITKLSPGIYFLFAGTRFIKFSKV